MPEGHAALGERPEHPAVEGALDERQQRGVRTRDGEDVGPRVVGRAQRDVAAGREVLERRARQRGVEARGRRARRAGRGRRGRPRAGLRRAEGGRLEGALRRHLGGPAPRAGGERGPQLAGAVGAEQLVEAGVVRRAERADDRPRPRGRARQSQEKCVPTGSGAVVDARHRGGERARERLGARPDEADELLDGRRRLGLDAVGVVGRVAEQRVGDLRLAGEDGLGPGGLRDGRHPGVHEHPDLGLRVEARPVDVAVAAAVADGAAGLARAVEQGAAQRLAERAVEDPVPAPRRARLGVQRAQRPVGQAVGREVQVVEDEQRPELELRVQRPAHGDGQDRLRPALAQRPDVGLVGDRAAQEPVPVAVARDVQRPRRPRTLPDGDERLAERRRDAGRERPPRARAGSTCRTP